MFMDLVVEIPPDLIREVVKEMDKIPCKRKQPVFELSPKSGWEISWCCRTNRGIGSDNGYGIGHTCKEDCELRIKY